VKSTSSAKSVRSSFLDPRKRPRAWSRFQWYESLGLIVVGVERQRPQFSLRHTADSEWRACFMDNPKFAPEA
jgi:hypothetical protein